MPDWIVVAKNFVQEPPKLPMQFDDPSGVRLRKTLADTNGNLVPGRHASPNIT